MTAHEHDEHAHGAPPNPYLEPRRSEAETRELEARVAKLEQALTDNGIVTRETLDRVAAIYENDIGPMNGAHVVARAWRDPAYKARLLEDATSAIAELGYTGLQGEHMVVVENTPDVHNVVVCTLCSCYPWPVLGLPPTWYKSPAYRSRVVIDPRGVLADFGLTMPKDVEVRVWDSSAEIRYLVLPEPPPGAESLSEDALAALVTRDAMIGVAKVTP